MATLSEYRHLATGKVRELYEVDDDLLLMVASDRISAFDHVLPSPIPDKGRVLTAMSVFWFELLADLVPNHVVAVDDPRIPRELLGRALLVHRLQMLPVECVARGYLTGSGLADYQRTGAVCGIALPAGLVEADRLPEPIFTPATKAEIGAHDENVSFDVVAATVGAERAEELRSLTLTLYERAAEYAATRGLLLADTKVEFGLRDGVAVLGDEVLTPDSVPVLAGRRIRAGAGAALVRQAVRPGLADLRRIRLASGHPTPRPRRCRSTSSARPGPGTSMPTSGSRDGRSTTGSAEPSGGRCRATLLGRQRGHVAADPGHPRPARRPPRRRPARQRVRAQRMRPCGCWTGSVRPGSSRAGRSSANADAATGLSRGGHQVVVAVHDRPSADRGAAARR